MSGHRFFARIMGVFLVPLQSPGGWETLAFRKIPKHEVSFGAEGLSVRVKGSASPVIYPLGGPKLVSGFVVKGRRSGALRLPTGVKQGDLGADDFALRVGLVVAGEKRLNLVQKWTAARWIQRLYEIAPPGQGIDRIEFFNAYEGGPKPFERRQHPLSRLIFENTAFEIGADGNLSMSVSLKESLKVLALWISADGDDLKQSFELKLTQIELQTP